MGTKQSEEGQAAVKIGSVESKELNNLGLKEIS